MSREEFWMVAYLISLVTSTADLPGEKVQAAELTANMAVVDLDHFQEGQAT